MSTLLTSQAESHSFNTTFASIYGVHEAILISHFQYWINYNKRLNRNFKDGRTWTYQTRKEIAAWFPYFTEKQVRTVIDNLIKKEVIVKGNYNNHNFDKTVWYAFKNEEIFTSAQMGHRATDQPVSPSAQMGQPIPNTIPSTIPIRNIAIPPTPQRGEVPSAPIASSVPDDPPSARVHPKQEVTKTMAPEKQTSAETKKSDATESIEKEFLKTSSKEERDVYWQLLQIMPHKKDDQMIGPPMCIRILRENELERVKMAIKVLEQDKRRYDEKNAKIGSILAYLISLLNKPREPIPDHAQENKTFFLEWIKDKSSKFFKLSEKYITIPSLGDYEIPFLMNPLEFRKTLETKYQTSV